MRSSCFVPVGSRRLLLLLLWHRSAAQVARKVCQQQRTRPATALAARADAAAAE
jgi:hypothetical protein